MTDTVIDDLAAEMEMDPYDMFEKNLDLVGADSNEKDVYRRGIYAEEMQVAAKLMDWKGKWQPRGEWTEGTEKHGLGMALHTWGGRAGRAMCTVRVRPDGTIESMAGTQDLGTGTRTAIAITLAETFGIPISKVKVNIGTSKYPACGGSGGSTTIGGVTGPHRRAALNGLWKIFDKVAGQVQSGRPTHWRPSTVKWSAATRRSAPGKTRRGSLARWAWKSPAKALKTMV